MNTLKLKLISILMLMIIQRALAQAPSWTVNKSDFQYTMTVTAFLNLNGRTLSSEQDIAAAFVGDELRGSANLIYIESADRHLAYLTIYGNNETDVLEFKIYDSSNGIVVPVENTLNFIIDGQVGNAFQAFSLAKPLLNSEAEIKNFYFKNADTISSDISEGFVDIEVEFGQEIKGLTPEFIISENAKMFIGKTLQISGDTTLDFTFSHNYSVLSEDESVLNTYQVKVVNAQLGGNAGFSSTNVITANNDGDNDYWYVENASDYADHEFQIMDINGRILYKSTGYTNDWDGYFKGKKLDRGKYYFQVESKEKNSLITGNILVMY